MAKRTPWSWAASEQDAAAFRQEANRLVGEILMEINYVTMDYERNEHRQGQLGPRRIVNKAELAEPSWQHGSCDTVDFAVELVTASNRTFTVSWESPGQREGLGLRELAAIDSAVTATADAAIWAATASSTWSGLVGRAIENVELLYEPWNHDDSYPMWCPEIVLTLSGVEIRFLLAQGEFGTERIIPASDNIAVMREEPQSVR